jgi:hypothetical protein
MIAFQTLEECKIKALYFNSFFPALTLVNIKLALISRNCIRAMQKGQRITKQ